MPPRSADAPSSCGQTDKRTPALTTAPSPSTWGGIGAGGAGGGKRQRETHAPKREKRRTNLAPRGHTPARSAGAGGKGGLWFGRREEGARETETEGQKDRGGEGRQRHWKKRNTTSERKTEAGGGGGGEVKEEGNVERGEKEISPRAPSQAAREEEGTNPRPCSSRLPFGFGGEPVARRWGAFRTSLAFQQYLPQAYHHTHTPRNLVGVCVQEGSELAENYPEEPALPFNTYSPLRGRRPSTLRKSTCILCSRQKPQWPFTFTPPGTGDGT